MAPRLLPSSDPADLKRHFRAEGLARRDALHADARAAASARICARLLALPNLSRSPCVAAFWPLRSEVDLRPLIDALQARGQSVALPVVAHPTLLFRLLRPGDTLERRRFNVLEPPDTAPLARPDLLLVPLARFDRAGQRIGYGQGHYDRAIAALVPVATIGVAFAIQECARVPAEPHDRPLDAVVTEDEIIEILEA